MTSKITGHPPIYTNWLFLRVYRLLFNISCYFYTVTGLFATCPANLHMALKLQLTTQKALKTLCCNLI